jgi:hypothetical protein
MHTHAKMTIHRFIVVSLTVVVDAMAICHVANARKPELPALAHDSANNFYDSGMTFRMATEAAPMEV